MLHVYITAYTAIYYIDYHKVFLIMLINIICFNQDSSHH